MKVVVLVLLQAFLFQGCYSQDFSWWRETRQIEVLKTTRKDVEKLFGRPDPTILGGNPNSDYYNVKMGRVFVEYSDGLCSRLDAGEWNAPKDVVSSFTVSPKREVSLKTFLRKTRIDVNKFEIVPGFDDVPRKVFDYNNDVDGLYLTVVEKKYIVSIMVEAPSYRIYPKCD